MMTRLLAGEERIMSIESLVRHFSVVEDPRCQGKIEHRLTDILVIAVCAVIACAESWDDIALYGRSKLAWLRTFLDLPNGIPSRPTLPMWSGWVCEIARYLTSAGFTPTASSSEASVFGRRQCVMRGSDGA